MEALRFILDTLLTLVVVAFLLRLLLPVVRADSRNPLVQAIVKFTNPLVLPLRKVFPPAKRFDVASLVALLVVQVIGTAIVLGLTVGGLRPGWILREALHSLVQTVLQFYFLAILIYALLSWFAGAQYSPGQQLLARLCEPLLEPVRRVIPPLGGLDLSALFVLIALQALQILLR